MLNHGRMVEIKQGWRHAAARAAIREMRIAAGCCVHCGAYANLTRGEAGACATCLRIETQAIGWPYTRVDAPPAGKATAAPSRGHWRDFIPLDC